LTSTAGLPLQAGIRRRIRFQITPPVGDGDATRECTPSEDSEEGNDRVKRRRIERREVSFHIGQRENGKLSLDTLLQSMEDETLLIEVEHLTLF